MTDTVFYNIPKNEMNAYPYTPPSEDSSQSYNMNPSPQSYIMVNAQSPQYTIPQQYNFNAGYTVQEHNGPFLKILEQPVDKFRFRYKSEMAGTHGSLTGMTSDKSRKQTYPTVQLCNFQGGAAVVRCSLYQYSMTIERQPHAHRLVRKHGLAEEDDPHRIDVSSQENYEACFHSMGIIHTAKKNLVEELKRKKTILKREEIARNEQKIRELSTGEFVALTREAEDESKSMNLNIVCLRFDAFIDKGGILLPICDPVYSHAINNLKSALTGELKIVRMDHASSPAKGNREIFMLVEKVTKKNIRIRFFELDEDGETEVWSDFGKFNDLDVHHQYAIVFRTPPYRYQDLGEQQKVYVELLRPTDGSRSDPKEFIFFPSQNYQPGMKRSRPTCYSSSGSWTNSAELPATIPSTVEAINSTDLLFKVPALDSAELNMLFERHVAEFEEPVVSTEIENLLGSTFMSNYNMSENYEQDAPSTSKQDARVHTTKEDQDIVNRVREEFLSLIATKPEPKFFAETMMNLFLMDEFVNADGNNTLHILVKDQNVERLRFWFNAIQKSNMKHILDLTNKRGETIMHTALTYGDEQVIKLVLQNVPDLSVLDNDGNSALHYAVMKSQPKCVIEMILISRKYTRFNIDAENNDGLTALQMSVKMNKLSYVKLLCGHEADVNVQDKRNGNNILHIAVADNTFEIVQFLLENTNVNVLHENFQGMTPLHMCKRLMEGGLDQGSRSKTSSVLQEFMARHGMHVECIIKEENESDDEDEMELDFVDCKTEKCSNEELQGHYKGVRKFTNQCLDQISAILDESHSWVSLAQLLDLEHFIHTSTFETAPSPSKRLLQWAVNVGEMFTIRNFLENLEEFEAVSIMDKMVVSIKSES